MKKLIPFIIAGILIIVFLWVYTFEMMDYDYLYPPQQWLAKSVFSRMEETIKQYPPDDENVISYNSLLSKLNFLQRIFADKIFSINPKELGFKGPYYSNKDAERLVKIKSVVFSKDRETGVQYLPNHVYDDYLKMVEQMKKDIGKQLYVDSGYRSPGKQAYLFFYYLVTSSNFSLKENSRWIAMPGYSEHGHPLNTAIDFCSEDGINGFSDGQTSADFIKLPQYRWMVENGQKFNFHNSYPEGNKLGVAFEPWHWHWGNS